MKKIYIGLDIGGVNIKCSSVVANDAIFPYKNAISTKVHFPLWKNTLSGLNNALHETLRHHLGLYDEKPRENEHGEMHVCASITGELSDAFDSKNDGIDRITSALERACESTRNETRHLEIHEPLFVLVDGTLRNGVETRKEHRLASAANWYATASWIGCLKKDCILIDCGSTTTDIIPIVNGMPVPEGKTDMARLLSGELVYTGVLRATIPSVSHHVPISMSGIISEISFENFALMADVHFLLGNITKQQYDCETADGREVSRNNCLKRLARIVCEDATMLGEPVLLEIARFLKERQVELIARALAKVVLRYVEIYHVDRERLACVVTGLGEDFLAGEAARRSGFKYIMPVSEILDQAASITSSAIGALHMIIREGARDEG